MTPERRWMVGIEEIRTISLECNECKVRLSYSPDEMIDLPQTCPNSLCRSVWNPPNTKAAPTEFDAPASVRLLRAIDRVKQEKRAIEANSTLRQGFRILLGFDER